MEERWADAQNAASLNWPMNYGVKNKLESRAVGNANNTFGHLNSNTARNVCDIIQD